MFDHRAKTPLKALSERSIADGQPVSSRTLSEDSGLDHTPATIRNVMADLKELGLIACPHTSARRVPTARVHSLFVDNMLTARPLSPDALPALQFDVSTERGQLHPDQPQRVIAQAAQMLSSVSNFVGVVTALRKRSVFVAFDEQLVVTAPTRSTAAWSARCVSSAQRSWHTYS